MFVVGRSAVFVDSGAFVFRDRGAIKDRGKRIKDKGRARGAEKYRERESCRHQLRVRDLRAPEERDRSNGSAVRDASRQACATAFSSEPLEESPRWARSSARSFDKTQDGL